MAKVVSSKILEYITENNEVSVKQLVQELDISKQYVHIVLTKLLAEEKVIKIGKVPKTLYKLNKSIKKNEQGFTTTSANEKFLNEHFLLITEIGEMLKGIPAFVRWCTSRNLPIEKTLQEYITTKQKYLSYYKGNGLINGLEKLKNTKGYDAIYLDDIFYMDFYAIERFGKTRLGTLLHYAKQAQNKFLMNILVLEIKNTLIHFVTTQKFDAYIIVPPTIKRELQLMKYLETNLKLPIPKLAVQKISGLIPVPQKSLNKIEERINNARHSFTIKEDTKYKKILIIDDAIGSGATINQIAEKLRVKKQAKTVVGLAIVGSYKGFDVITDV